MNTHLNIHIPFLTGLTGEPALDVLSLQLDALERSHIAHAPWGAPGSLPKADFVIAHDDSAVYLKFYVREQTIKADYLNYNDPVYEDTCVEFFIALNNDDCYYNLEFNCLGTCLVQYGATRANRTFIPERVINAIRSQALIRKEGAGDISWELTLSIPKTIFIYHPGLSFEESRPKVNFYKCGDRLPQPHFLCWNKVEAPQPDFHLSSFFKEVLFNPRPTPQQQ